MIGGGIFISYSEQELLACKNFGQTSLDEVNLRLAEHGLALREELIPEEPSQ